MSRLEALELYRSTFGSEPTGIAHAPGRINLIGEHTDYSGGFVLPMAVDLAIWVAFSVTEGNSELVSASMTERVCTDLTSNSNQNMSGWGKYPAGVAWAYQQRLGKSVPNLNAALVSNLPIASRLSSSAALEVVFATIWNRLLQTSLSCTELALLCKQAENEFVGLNCGIMDMLASTAGKEDHALLIDTRSLDIDFVPLPESCQVLICDTRCPKALTGSAYNERQEETMEAARLLDVPSLRDASLDEVTHKLSGTLLRRARHVVTENQRTLAFAQALRSGNLSQLGTLLREGQRSLDEDFDVSSFELRAMVQAAEGLPGLIGIRQTGGGFGGACIAFVESADVEAFVPRLELSYQAATGIRPGILPTRPSGGASSDMPDF